jgi:hypothetical protein
MALTGTTAMVVASFLVYAWSVACLEGISKAWITLVTDRNDTATAIGTYAAFLSLCTMVASALTGFLWYRFGAGVAFGVSAAVAVLVAIYFTKMEKPVFVSNS